MKGGRPERRGPAELGARTDPDTMSWKMTTALNRRAKALADLQAELGISEADFGGKLTIEGQDPVVGSRHHVGDSTAVLLSLFGLVLDSELTGVPKSILAAPGLQARLRPEFDLPLATSTGPLGEMAVLPAQVELSKLKLAPRFSGEPNGASKLDWSVFNEKTIGPVIAERSAQTVHSVSSN